MSATAEVTRLNPPPAKCSSASMSITWEKIQLDQPSSTGHIRTCLLLAEPLGLLNGVVEFLHQLVVAAVGREVESVKAGVRPWQPRLLADFFYTESLRSITPWKHKWLIYVNVLD